MARHAVQWMNFVRYAKIMNLGMAQLFKTEGNMTDIIRIHQYTDSDTGHVNVEFIRNGSSLGFFGSNTTGVSGFG